MDADIIRMAREAGFLPNANPVMPQLLARFADLIRADERERIAAEWDGCMYGDLEDVNIGAAIRARSNP